MNEITITQSGARQLADFLFGGFNKKGMSAQAWGKLQRARLAIESPKKQNEDEKFVEYLKVWRDAEKKQVDQKKDFDAMYSQIMMEDKLKPEEVEIKQKEFQKEFDKTIFPIREEVLKYEKENGERKVTIKFNPEDLNQVVLTFDEFGTSFWNEANALLEVSKALGLFKEEKEEPIPVNA